MFRQSFLAFLRQFIARGCQQLFATRLYVVLEEGIPPPDSVFPGVLARAPAKAQLSETEQNLTGQQVSH